MTLLIIDHESRFKLLPLNDSSKKKPRQTKPEVCCSYCCHCHCIMLEYSKSSNDKRILGISYIGWKPKIIIHLKKNKRERAFYWNLNKQRHDTHSLHTNLTYQKSCKKLFFKISESILIPFLPKFQPFILACPTQNSSNNPPPLYRTILKSSHDNLIEDF